MYSNSPDYSQFTGEEMMASFHFHNQHPDLWHVISELHELAELENWLSDNDREGKRMSRTLFFLWLRNRVAFLLMMAGVILLSVSPAALVGKSPGFLGLVFDKLAVPFVAYLLITHPVLERFAAAIFTREFGTRDRLGRIGASSQMLRMRIWQLRRLNVGLRTIDTPLGAQMR